MDAARQHCIKRLRCAEISWLSERRPLNQFTNEGIGVEATKQTTHQVVFCF